LGIVVVQDDLRNAGILDFAFEVALSQAVTQQTPVHMPK
jgi:hypothetical protein